MRAEITRDIEVRPSSVALWSGIMAGPVAWAVDLELRYALLPWACRSGFRWVLTAISVPLLLLCAAGFFLAWRGWAAGEDESVRPMRVRFMAVGGMLLSAAFFLTIVAGTIPDFFFRPCD